MANLPTYTKRDVAKRMADNRKVAISTAESWADSVFLALRQIMESASPELRIEIRTFGVFEVKVARSRPQARNPRTGECIVVPERRKTRFKPSKQLRLFLRGPITPGQPSSPAAAGVQEL